MADLAEREVGTYWHCFPEFKQARKAIWNGINRQTGQRRIFDAFHPSTIKRMQDDDMFLELTSGSTFQLIGSDRYDATVGSGPRGIAYSEWALSNPSAWAYHMPMIRETNGWAAFITTPRGNNHAKSMFDSAQEDPATWFSQLLTVDDTGALTEADREEALKELQVLHGIEVGRAVYDQEYLCSFMGAMVGAYLGAEMNKAEREGRITTVEIDWSQPVHTVWDLGKAVNNPVGCFQVIGGRPKWVDFYEPESNDLADWATWLNDKGYNGNDYVPHDILVTEWGSTRTRFETLQSLGRKPKRLPRVSVADGLQAARSTINVSDIHAGTDERGKRMARWVDGCKNYRREWDDTLKTFRETPIKDWSEHIGSMTRYLGLAWRDVAPVKPKPQEPKELIYTANPDGSVAANMSVKELVELKMKQRRMRDG